MEPARLGGTAGQGGGARARAAAAWRRRAGAPLAALLMLAVGCRGDDDPGAALPGQDAAGATDAAPNADAADAADAEATPGPPPAWTERGPFTVGVRELDLHDAPRDRDVPTLVWYPALDGGEPAAEYLLGLVLGEALEDAAPDEAAGPWPMVLFSHGFKGASAQSASVTEHLASWGYVVVAMDHLGNTLFDPDDDQVAAEVAQLRPGDVAFAAASVLTTMGGLVDATRVAVMGHSFGGFTALVVAGATSHIADARAACAAGDPSDIFCDYVPFMADDAVITLDPPLAGLRAAIYLAPGGYSALGADGLAGIRVPGLILGGTLDSTTPLDAEVRRIYQDHPQPVLLGEIDGAAHLSFTELCLLEGIGDALGDFCGGPDALDGHEVLRITAGLATAFLELNLRGDERARPWLTHPALDHLTMVAPDD
ncbi:MAG: alpha/beta hydrolase [Deltaproteobacteria bacterium]|nr:alpha/beta hydrolase [Deltaproteobacteria bacterium]MCB9786361.1 alpha/beta hydrolase [Deltaproteobacteria bacterium]